MDTLLKNLRPAGRHVTNVLCGLVAFQGGQVVGCGAPGVHEEFYYDLDTPGVYSSVAFCPTCAAHQRFAQHVVSELLLYGASDEDAASWVVERLGMPAAEFENVVEWVRGLEAVAFSEEAS